jgi:hypothetical protein
MQGNVVEALFDDCLGYGWRFWNSREKMNGDNDDFETHEEDINYIWSCIHFSHGVLRLLKLERVFVYT